MTEATLNEQTTGARNRSWRRVLGLARLAVVAVLIYVLFRLVPVESILEAAVGARPELLILAVGIGFANVCVSALKLWVLLRVRGCPIRFVATLRAYYIGSFFNNFLPTSVGGDVVKIGELRRQGAALSDAAAATVVERGTGVAMVMGIAVMVSLGAPELFRTLALDALRWPVGAIGAAFYLGLGALYVLWRGRLKGWLKRRREAAVWRRLYSAVESFYVYRNRPAGVLAAIGLSAVFYALLAANIAVVSAAVGPAVGWGHAAGIVPLVKIPEMLPVTLGGLGLREGAMAYCLSRLGPGAGQAAATALLLRLVTWVHSAAGGLFYALSGNYGTVLSRSVEGSPDELA